MQTSTHESRIDAYFTNALYDRNFFYNDLASQLPSDEEALVFFEKCSALASGAGLGGRNEAQLEHDFVRPLLEAMGWSCLPQVGRVIQGKEIKPDWRLFPSAKEKERFLASPDDASPSGSVLCEVKAPGRVLDTKKAAKKDNPYIQLLEYLTYSRVSFGFLTNGLEWRLVDNSRVSSEKRFVEVHLGKILEAGDVEAMRRFLFFSRRETYFKDKKRPEAAIDTVARLETQAKIRVENDLRGMVYGIDGRASLFERLGRALYKASGSIPTPDNLRLVFENALYLLFRLLFVASFEDKYAKQLSKHPHYPHLSLRRLHDGLAQSPSAFRGWRQIKSLFAVLAEGSRPLGIPLLNGGLFDNANAPLLGRPDAVDDAALKSALDDLLLYHGGLLRRDYKTLSVTNLGSIYEGLLEYEFRVTETTLVYLDYREGTKALSGYFDVYDAERVKSSRRVAVNEERGYEPGSLYLVNARNTRKSAGSYYTPAGLSIPLVRRAIDHQLKKGVSILDLRILDNACGSGHLLIDALNHLTRRALETIEHDEALEAELAAEKAKIEHSIEGFREDLGDFPLDIDELAVLKRILLKQVIYGVDAQPFAVELAQLALWIDTYIFGTPLSFIDHHIKTGNSLIGSSQRRFLDFVAPEGQLSLFQGDLNSRFNALRDIVGRLNAIRDATPQEVRESKAIYRDEIQPALRNLDRALDVVNYRDMLIHEGNTAETLRLEQRQDLGATLLNGRDPELAAKIDAYKTHYRFFNWEVEFPEAFAGSGPKGFHIIVGNPPWDKTKFLDPDFFSQYRSNYRGMDNAHKAAVRRDLLDDPAIKRRYEGGKIQAKAVNAYYKARYPKNSGAGDGNLFRFFIERNLALLLPGGTLNLVVPTGFLTEEGSDGLRKHVLTRFRLNRFDGFENRKKIFPDVHPSYKFGLIQIERTRDPEQKARMRFMLTEPEVLGSDRGCFDYSLKQAQVISPGHWAYMEASGGGEDLRILSKLYGRFDKFDPAWLNFRRELDATNDKGIFRQPLDPTGYFPLYKGASIWQYDSAYAPPEYWLDPREFDAHLEDTEISRLIREVYPQLPEPKSTNQTTAVMNALGVRRKKTLKRFIKPDRLYFRLGFRDIASDTNERTLIAAIVPKNIGAQNTLWLSIPKTYVFTGSGKIEIQPTPLNRLLFAQAILNAIPVDWLLRFSAAIHVNKTYLMRLPLPQPADAELESNPAYQELIRNSLRLSVASNPQAFEELRLEFALEESDIPATEKGADKLKIRNDCLVAGLYGLTVEELAHMLASFNVLRRKKPQYLPALLDAYARHTAR